MLKRKTSGRQKLLPSKKRFNINVTLSPETVRILNLHIPTGEKSRYIEKMLRKNLLELEKNSTAHQR